MIHRRRPRAHTNPVPKYREDLDTWVCTNPNCDHSAADHGLYIHARCHGHDPPWAEYVGGAICFRCSVCNKPVVQIAFASKQEPS